MKMLDHGRRNATAWALFAEQDQAYGDALLPPTLAARVAVEQASTSAWERHVGDHGIIIIGMTSFGASGLGDDVRAHFGFTSEAMAEAVCQVIGHDRSEA